MIGLDTNFLVRCLVDDDDPKQEAEARLQMKQALDTEGVFISIFVIVETAWVLRGKKIARKTIYQTLSDLSKIEGITISHEQLIPQALDLFLNGKADFCDYLILLENRMQETRLLHTFDKKFKKEISL